MHRIDHAGHDDADALALAGDLFMRVEQLTDARGERRHARRGSCAVGMLTMSDSGRPIGSASIRKMRLARMSTATLDRLRVLM